MPRPYARHTAHIEGDFVVFLIGARVVKPWRIDEVARVAKAMVGMVKELEANPGLGYLGQESWFGRTGIQVQYWRSREQLLAYAHAREAAHLPAWRHFNQVIAKTTAVGIWHETYCVRAGEYECIYGNMPPFGLAKAAQRAELTAATESARQRLNID